MFIAEVFSSLQGEGLLAGTPSFFIRTSGCNLRCRWCDTPYTSWQAEGQRRTIADLLAAARQSHLRHVVITGGEPLLQREFPELCQALTTAGYHVTVETAGTVMREFVCDLLSVSPKTFNSDPEGSWGERHRRLREDHAALRQLLQGHREYQLKFVVEGYDDMPEILGLVEEVQADPQRVLLMCEGKTAEEVRTKAPVVARLCLRYGFRYSPRLHLDVFGLGRGV